MSIEDTIHIDGWCNECVVCGKSLRRGEEFGFVRCNGDSAPVCGADCEKDFQARPRLYIFRRLSRELTQPKQPASFGTN